MNESFVRLVSHCPTVSTAHINNKYVSSLSGLIAAKDSLMYGYVRAGALPPEEPPSRSRVACLSA